MSKDARYFTHDSNAHTDLKIKALLKKYGWCGFGWYWYMIETLREESDYKLELNEVNLESLSEEMKIETDEVKKYIDYLVKVKLLKQNSVGVYSERLSRDMAKLDAIREKNRISGSMSHKGKE